MESKTGSRSSTFLAPGFRFHPTDEELVQYYLKRRVRGKASRFDAIADVDVYKAEPWDLPYMSKLKTRDLEWYFFSLLDKKYGNGARTNRATEKGYWKTTGKDRPVYHKMQVVGMKKTLVYHIGRAPKGQRTNWVMHEYRLAGMEFDNAGNAQDAFVVCRIFQKSGSGPKNGEQYGAPLVEEGWDDDELDLVHENAATQEVDSGDNLCLNIHDIHQILGLDVPSNTTPLPMTFPCADDSFSCQPKQPDENNTCIMPAASKMDSTPANQESIGECSKPGNSDELDFLLHEPFLDSFDYLPNADEEFLEANDLSKPTETDSIALDMLEEYCTYFDANDDSSLYFALDPALSIVSENLISGQKCLPQKEINEEAEQAVLPSGQLTENNDNNAISSSGKPKLAKYQSDSEYQFVKRASQMLGNVPAAPAFAAEFPSEDAILRLSSTTHSHSPVHVAADTIRQRNSNMGQNLNIVLSFGYSRGNDGSSSLESSVRIVTGSNASRLYFIFFWVLIIYISFRMGSFICVI